MFTIHSWNYTEKTKNLLYGSKNLGVPPAKKRRKQNKAGVGLSRAPPPGSEVLVPFRQNNKAEDSGLWPTATLPIPNAG